MRRPKVKFCGFRDRSDVRKAVSLPIDAIGFILVPNRRRTVSSEHLPSLLQAVPDSIKTVGVFKNPEPEEIKFFVKQGGLQVIQLHGEERPEFCQWLKETYGLSIWKVFHADKDLSSQPLESYQGLIDVAMLDHAKGGTGTPFAWEQIPFFQERCSRYDIPLWIAGGIDQTNIQTLLTQYQPDGVDISSGIESDGDKDWYKMKGILEGMKSI